MVPICVIGVDANAKPKFKIATDDKLVAKFCNSVMHHQWYTLTQLFSVQVVPHLC